MIACMGALACSDMQFLIDDFSPGETQPLTLETVTLSNYKMDHATSAPLEFMRIHGVTAEMAESPGETQMTIQTPQVYFYNMDEPNAQIYYVRATTGVVHLRDDRATSPPAHSSGDIDFVGDVMFLNREAMMRVMTDRLRYSATKRSIATDQMTTRTEALGDTVALETMAGGFRYEMAEGGVLTSDEGSQQENLEGPEAEQIRKDIHANIAAIPWVSGPDDTPIAIPPLIPVSPPALPNDGPQEEAT